jgi:hypothetical protein
VSGSDYERRMIRNIAGIVVLALVMGAGVILVRTTTKKGPEVLGTRQTSTPTPTFPPLIFPTPTIPAGSTPPITHSQEPTPAPKPTTTPLPASCHNSTNPACGRFYWSPSVGSNAPTEIQVSYSPNGTAGEPVTVTVTLHDGDATPNGLYGSWGDGTGVPAPTCKEPQRYGPWTPPAKSGGTRTWTLHHTYSNAGTFTVTLIGISGTCGNPYGGRVTTTLTIHIDPAPPSPSPSPTAS